MIKTVQKYDLSLSLRYLSLWIAKGIMLLSILGSLLHSTTASAGTTVALSESFAGNLSFQLAAGSFRDSSSDNCSIKNRAEGTLSGIPIGAEIKAAFLYVAASYNSSTETADSDVYFGPSAEYRVTFTPTTEIYRSDIGWAFYSGKADVTDIITANQSSPSFAMEDLTINNSSDGWVNDGGWEYVYGHCSRGTTLGGWALVVVYEDDSEPFQVLNLFDGFQIFYGSSIALIPDNFEVSSTLKGKHAHITWEGDTHNSESNGYTEALKLQTSKGEFELTDSGNPISNQFNSYSNIYEAETLGVDVDAYDVSDYLFTGDTSVTTTYSSGGDLVLLSAEIISVTNVPVADLAVTTSTPTGWQSNSTVTKKFTVSNNGPNDVPTQSVRFTTTLPSDLTFNGTQGDSDWLCTQTGQALACIYQNKLRSGWSDYLDLTFDVGDVAGNDATMAVSVDHNTAPYDIFDNQVSNNTYSMTVPVATDPVIDLSASSKVPDNLNGDLLLAGDTLQYTITIDDVSNQAITGITVTDTLPENIITYRVTQYPAGSSWSESSNPLTLTFTGIDLAEGTGDSSTQQIMIEVDIDPNAPEGASLQNQATISYGTNGPWVVDTGDITVVEPNLSPSTLMAIDKNGGLLLAGDTISVTITIDDQNELDISNAQALLDLPITSSGFSNISITVDGITDTDSLNSSTSTGGSNGTGLLDIQNINFLSNTTSVVTFDFTIDESTSDGTLIPLSSLLKIGDLSWPITGPTLEVVSASPPASGNKPLYIVDSTLTRIQPTTDASALYIGNEDPLLEWTISPMLQDDLILGEGDFPVQLAIEGRQTNDNNYTELVASLYYDGNNGDGRQLISSGSFPNGRWDDGEPLVNLTHNLNIASDITIPSGSSVILTLDNITYNANTGGVRPNNNSNHRVYIHRFDGSFFSAVILNSKTVINVDSIEVWSAPFLDNEPDGIDDSGATLITSSQPDTTLSIRATLSDPFGAFDITDAIITVTPPNSAAVLDAISMSVIDDQIDDYTTNLKSFESTLTLAEEDEITGYWTITVTGIEGVEGDVEHTEVTAFQVSPFLPSILINKSVSVIKDPINGTATPKAIPGAELLYTIHAINSGRGKSDDGSLIIQDEIPLNSDLYIDTITCSGTDQGPLCFQEGANPNESGLSFTFNSLTDNSDDLYFSTDGSDFTYEPVDSGDGYDPAIRFIRMTPANELNNAPKDASKQPEFKFYYQTRLN